MVENANDLVGVEIEVLSDGAALVGVPSAEQRLQEARARLDSFLTINPTAEIRVTDSACIIEKPWGESGLSFEFPLTQDPIYDALNNVGLPARYSALWHVDTRDLEVIFTAYKMPPRFSVYRDRKFEYVFRGTRYQCEFGPSSERLLQIALRVSVTSQSPTQWRNLPSYSSYMKQPKRDAPPDETYAPLSFWIRNVDLTQEDATLELITHLNFFMTYYDTLSPRVLIHSVIPDMSDVRPIQNPSGAFPPEIRALEIDDNLLQFWDASLAGDPIRKFLYNYQIIEYAAVYYVDEDAKRSIRRLLLAPDATSNIDAIVSSMIDTLVPKQAHDIQKRVALLKNCVSPDLIWAELQQHKQAFEERTEFDGGYVIEPLIVKDMRFVTFKNNWASSFEGAVRILRNGLSHGKEFSTSGVISPTIANQAKIQPWLGPLSLAARQVMLYRGTL